ARCPKGRPQRLFFFSSRRRHTRSKRDWSSDVCSSDLAQGEGDQGEDDIGGVTPLVEVLLRRRAQGPYCCTPATPPPRAEADILRVRFLHHANASFGVVVCPLVDGPCFRGSFAPQPPPNSTCGCGV